MTERFTFAAYMHVEGFDNFHREAFDKRKVRAAMRKAGRVVAIRAKLNLALAGSGSNYPRKISGVLRDSINMRVSRSGFMVKVMPDKTSGMKDYYPAYLHYGVRQGASIYHTNGKKNSWRCYVLLPILCRKCWQSADWKVKSSRPKKRRKWRIWQKANFWRT